MVGAPTQALVAQQLGMDNYIISRQQLTQEKMGWKQKILADLMEAFIAALFINLRLIEYLHMLAYIVKLFKIVTLKLVTQSVGSAMK